MRWTVWLFGLVLLAAGVSAPVYGGGSQPGHAVAVTPDGTRLVAGGSNRALYELDPKTLEVKRRVYLGTQIMNMAFSPDGKTLVVESRKVIQWLKADTLEVFETLKRAEGMSRAPAIGVVAVQNKAHPPKIQLRSLADASVKAEVAYESTKGLAGFALKPDGTKLAFLYTKKKDESEEKIGWKDTPEELKKKRDHKLRLYQQHHDGYSAMFYVVDVATGKAELEKKLWYAPPSGMGILFWQGDDVYWVGYENQNAKLDPTGEVTYFELANGLNYARHAKPGGSLILSGGLRDGTLTKTEGLVATKFRMDDVGGFPEYYKAFTFADDGTAFGGTTEFRVVRIEKDGTLGKTAPVY